MLAEDAVFYSPTVFAPQRGRAPTAAYLRAAERMFSGTGFHYVEKWFGDNSAVLRTSPPSRRALRGRHRHDPLERGWRITSVKVMIPPFQRGPPGRHRQDGRTADVPLAPPRFRRGSFARTALPCETILATAVEDLWWNWYSSDKPVAGSLTLGVCRMR